MKWSERFKRPKSPRRRRRQFSRRRTKSGCAVCGEERFAHKPNSYYGHIEHAFRR